MSAFQLVIQFFAQAVRNFLVDMAEIDGLVVAAVDREYDLELFQLGDRRVDGRLLSLLSL